MASPAKKKTYKDNDIKNMTTFLRHAFPSANPNTEQCPWKAPPSRSRRLKLPLSPGHKRVTQSL